MRKNPGRCSSRRAAAMRSASPVKAPAINQVKGIWVALGNRSTIFAANIRASPAVVRATCTPPRFSTNHPKASKGSPVSPNCAI